MRMCVYLLSIYMCMCACVSLLLLVCVCLWLCVCKYFNAGKEGAHEVSHVSAGQPVQSDAGSSTQCLGHAHCGVFMGS